MDIPERLNYELRDKNGHIVAATQDYNTAKTITGFLTGVDIYECNFPVDHFAWFPCDFSDYFKYSDATPTVKIEGVTYVQKKAELEVKEI